MPPNPQSPLDYRRPTTPPRPGTKGDDAPGGARAIVWNITAFALSFAGGMIGTILLLWGSGQVISLLWPNRLNPHNTPFGGMVCVGVATGLVGCVTGMARLWRTTGVLFGIGFGLFAFGTLGSLSRLHS